MNSETKIRLEEAKEHFQALRLQKAYGILRRYYDRLPFCPEPEHAEYIGIFVRTLVELGKQFEIKFYLQEVERLFERSKSPALAYQLAFLYCFLPEPRWETARRIFEQILVSPGAAEFAAKAKMMLAHYYSGREDVAACRKIIFSIEEPPDENLKLLVDIWKANVLRKEKNFPAAQEILCAVLDQVSLKSNWYPYFSARVIEAHLQLETGRWNQVEHTVSELKEVFTGNCFKTIQIELKSIESVLKEKKQREFCPTRALPQQAKVQVV